jgi:hypothetical protein
MLSYLAAILPALRRVLSRFLFLGNNNKLRRQYAVCVHFCLCVYLFQTSLLHQLPSFHVILYKYYAIGR